MFPQLRILAAAAALNLLVTISPCTAEVLGPPSPVLTQRNDTNRTGTYVQQGFGPSVFAENKWGLVGTLPVEGVIYAQPLYAPGLIIAGVSHNVVIVATAQNHLYAFDADTLQVLWDTMPCHTLPFSLGGPAPCIQAAGPDLTDSNPDLSAARFAGGVAALAAFSPTSVDSNTLQQSQPGIGIQSTPVMDPSCERLYFTYRTAFPVGNNPPNMVPTSRVSFTVEQHVAVLDPHDGSIKLDRNINSDLNGNENSLRQRASLLLSNGILYVAFAAHIEDYAAFAGDSSFLYRGLLLAYDASTLRLLGQFQTVPNSKLGGGIWMASSGIAADQDGSIYFTVGNLFGYKNDTLHLDASILPNDCPGNTQVCTVAGAAVRLKPSILRDVKNNLESVLFLTQPAKPAGVFDFFMPYRAVWHNAIDLDLGSSGVLLVPGTRGMVFGGKEGILYVVNRDAMGGYDTSIAWNAQTESQNAVSPNCNGNGGAPVSCGATTSSSSPGFGFTPFTQGVCPYVPDTTFSSCGPPGPHGISVCSSSFQETGAIEKIQLDSASNCASPPMDDGLVWPHVHGTPAYADLADGRSFLYVWPEKSALQVYERDRTASILGFNFAGRSGNCTQLPGTGVCAPAGDGRAMPGGFVSVVVDPSGTGIVFASVPADLCLRDLNTNECKSGFAQPGRLYAFDPVPQNGHLKELWDNSGDPVYGFAKFVPPTIANGRVYLATANNQVLVYGIATPPSVSGSPSPGGIVHNCGTPGNLPCLQ